MKNRLLKIFTILIIILSILTGCTEKPNGNETLENVDNRESVLKVYTSFYPYHDFAKNVGGDNVAISTVVPDSTEPHSFEPSPKTIAELENTDVFIYNGLDMEPWLDKVLKLLEGKEIYLVDASSAVELIKYDGSISEDDHSHEDEDNHGTYDPHIWVDPVNAIEISEAIKDAFISKDPNNENIYKENFTAFKDKLTKLDSAFKNELANIPNKKILVSHSAFGYLANSYDIEEIAIAGISPNAEPSPKRLAELTKIAKENKISYIFFESLANVKTAEVLANEANLEVLTLYNVEGLTDEQKNNGENYISLMYKNLETLKKALVK